MISFHFWAILLTVNLPLLMYTDNSAVNFG